MCIAVYKPMGVNFPSKRTIRACFNNNPDGAGFMVATGETVEISKGYMGFTEFWKELRASRERYGEDKAYVLHFRISTQGGVRQDCCHPFPLSSEMSDLRKLRTSSDIGVAHNGIISLTSSYGKGVDYSDTMSFITEYLSLIIKDRDYYKSKETLKLIEKLCGSRLAILDKTGHCELVGDGWRADNNVWYSNDSYHERKTVVKTTWSYPTWGYPSISKIDDELDDLYEDIYSKYEDCLTTDGLYDFHGMCPAEDLGDCSYCDMCVNYMKCFSNEVAV